MADAPSIGVIGLAVMGSNLARNIERNGFGVAVYNRSPEKTREFMEAFGANSKFVSAESMDSFVAALAPPRQIIIMVKAGGPTDAVISQLLELVEPGDIIIDGGNAYFTDTVRREKLCAEKKVNFLGVGISGGEEGALNGPSIMPGGPKNAWQIVSPLLEKIAADADGPCTAYMGPDGAGHFVKMVHNGIEYGDMQLIAEAYDLLQRVGGLTPPELEKVFSKWNEGVLSSFLIEITAKIFAKHDDQGDGFLVDKILDKAGQKGTGKWTVQVALDLGVAVPTIDAAVSARIMSSVKAERINAEPKLSGGELASGGVSDKDAFVQQVHDALYCAKVMSYAQGMAMLRAASEEYNWNLNLRDIAAIWRGGCIIRARFLTEIMRAYKETPELPNLMLDPAMNTAVSGTIDSLRAMVQAGAIHGIPLFGMGGSLSYYDSYRTADLPQNLTQAQRDFFGAHTYQRKDMDGVFHTEWE